jgi:hypothetical protein
MPFINCANISIDYVDTSVDYANIFTNCAHTSINYAHTSNDCANIYVDSIDALDTPTLDFYIYIYIYRFS